MEIPTQSILIARLLTIAYSSSMCILVIISSAVIASFLTKLTPEPTIPLPWICIRVTKTVTTSVSEESDTENVETEYPPKRPSLSRRISQQLNMPPVRVIPRGKNPFKPISRRISTIPLSMPRPGLESRPSFKDIETVSVALCTEVMEASVRVQEQGAKVSKSVAKKTKIATRRVISAVV